MGGGVPAIGFGRAENQEFLYSGGIDDTGSTCITGRRGLVRSSIQGKHPVGGF